MASLARRAAGIVQAMQGNLIPGNRKKPARDSALSPGKPHYTILQYDTTASSLSADFTHMHTHNRLQQ